MGRFLSRIGLSSKAADTEQLTPSGSGVLEARLSASDDGASQHSLVLTREQSSTSQM